MDQIFRISAETVLTPELLMKYIKQNQEIARKRYLPLERAYDGQYEIFDYKKYKKKPWWKPDNRIAADFAGYVTDTFEGLFIGNPVRVASENKIISEWVHDYEDGNDQDDKNSEISAITSIYGRAYELLYLNEDAELRSAYLDPVSSFAIYDEGITPKILYFVRTYTDSNRMVRGSISDDTTVSYFHVGTGSQIIWDEESRPHGFNGVPVIEYVANEARRGIYEKGMSLINAFNRVLSEKADDVQYFADAYLAVIGPEVQEEDTYFIRSSKILNFPCEDAREKLIKFLEKPDGDVSQEHLLDRLQDLIFITSMVSDIHDPNFGASSGIALEYKLLAMLNLAKRKERKFTKAMRRRYQLICSNPLCPLDQDAWKDLTFTFTFNLPQNLDGEAETAARLEGIVSKQTQLKAIPSLVEDVHAEMDLIKAEQEEILTDYETNRVLEDGDEKEDPTDT